MAHSDSQALQDILSENAKLARHLEDLDKEYTEAKAKVEQARAQLAGERQKGQQMRAQVEDKREMLTGQQKAYEGVIQERVSYY